MSDDAPSALAELETHAEALRKELAVPRQNDVFRAAVEAGYLAALADGVVDEDELGTMADAIELLSEGAVVEWETVALLEECADKAEKEGAGPRATAVGKELKKLGQAEVGLLFAALIANASGGVDDSEAAVLLTVGAAAGLQGPKVKAIVKRAKTLGKK
jgi:tellurite resistance protein